MGRARTVTRVVALLCLCNAVDGPRAVPPNACEVAFAAHAWPAVLAACGAGTTGGARPRDRVQHAWAQFYLGHREQALAESTALADSSERAEARFLGGLLLTTRADPHRVDDGRRLLTDALGLFVATANAARAADAAAAQVPLALQQRRFDDALALARLAVGFASAAGDPGRHGSALMTLAATYDAIGRAEEARDAFRAAAEMLEGRPAERAWVYFKYATFLLDLQTPVDATAALAFLAAAARNADRAAHDGQAERVADLAVAIPFNRAAGLSALGRDEEALASLSTLPSTARGHAMFQMITGIAAARRGDTDAALARLDQPLAVGGPDGYAVSVAVELAALCRAKGRFADAERALRRAIAQVESVRVHGSVELRPWILAHRASPYEALIELLVEQRRAADALTVIEALHARAWLDATATVAPGAAAAPAWDPRSPAASAPLDRDALLERLGDREALVFLDLGPTAWRAHVVDRVVRVERIPAAALEVIAAFRSAPDRLDAAAAAAAVLLPPELAYADRALTIVASGRFADLPFAALRRGGRLLIADRAIARLPGLAAMRCPRHAASGPPVFIGDAAGDLPHAANEVRAVAAVHQVAPRIGAAATRAAVLASRDATWLHLAVHGELGPEGGAISLRDGAFTAAAVLREHVAPTVVVLAGCSTATATDLESWSGFPSAFLAAGSRVVIGTTRSVGDDAAAEVMQAFYAQPAALDPIARLAAAQRVVAAHLPATAWASFAAWGFVGCAEPARPGG